MNQGIVGFPGVRLQAQAWASEERQYVASTAYDFDLPIARPPDTYRAVLVNKTADLGYQPGDEVGMEFIIRPSTSDNCAVSTRLGTVRIVTGASFAIANRTTGVFAVGTATRWTIKLYAVWLSAL